MKRISFFLALTLILSFGLANADQEVFIEGVDGAWNADTLLLGTETVLNLRVVNTPGNGAQYNAGFSWRLYTTTGATWTPNWHVDSAFAAFPPPGAWTFDSTAIVWHHDDSQFPFIFTGFNFDYLNEGSGDEWIGAVAIWDGIAAVPALYDGHDASTWTLTFTPTGPEGSVICIDTVGQAWLGFEWSWPAFGTTYPAVIADWGPTGAGSVGDPRCWTLYEVPNLDPTITNAPANITGSHCAPGEFTFDFDALDVESDPYTFEIEAGSPGAIDANTGVWTFTPSMGDVGTSITLEVYACDNVASCVKNIASVDIIVTNDAPTFTAGCGGPVIAQTGSDAVVDFDSDDTCPADPVSYSVTDNGGAVGPAAFVGNVLTYTPDDADVGTVCMMVEVTDGNASNECEVCFNVSAGAPYGVQIEKTHGTLQGNFEKVDVTMPAQADEIGGFNFLIAYDASALTFQGADILESNLYQDCGWEYFDYRFGADGNCGNGCPSGLLRVIGMAETNNGPNHPTCFTVTGDKILFTLNFLVSSNATFNCNYVPIRFFWIECGDNTISNKTGTELYISATVKDFDYEFTGVTDIGVLDPDHGFPSYLGSANFCETSEKADVYRYIDFFNGGIDIVCADSIDARGDINLNGLAYEIADAVMFTNYFVYGLTALVYVTEENMYGYAPGFGGSIAASDVNADGLTLSVADLVYLIRVIVGDAQPYPKVNPISADYSVNNGVLSVDGDMGAVALTVAGDVVPTLLADNMNIMFNSDGIETKIIVYSHDGNFVNGDVVSVNGVVTSIEMAAADGSPVVAKLLPSDFALAQNYPNPFNPTTTIGFSLPYASDYTLTIYNVTGQVVSVFDGSAEAGLQSVDWDASNMASGIYFYKLNADNFSDTKKMVLLK